MESFRFISKYCRGLFFYLFTATIIMLSGCDFDSQSSPIPNSQHDKSLMKEQGFTERDSVEPIQVDNGAFDTVSGWIDSNTILYITETNHGGNVYSHNLQDGNSRLFFTSQAPIVSVQISPSQEYILIHSSPTANEALITILDKDGEKQMEERYTSSELSIEWNPLDDEKILLTAFKEDWSFSVKVLNLKESAMDEISLPQPFGKWIGEDELLYLDWDTDEPTLLADLNKFDLESRKSKNFQEEILQIDSFKDGYFTISTEEIGEKAIYTFYSMDSDELFSFQTPHLSSYSGWLVPYYDYIEESKTFLTLQPLYHTEADVYRDSFQLISYSLEQENQEVILTGMENVPLSCSPDGEKCLSGYYLENLIYLENKEIIPLIKNE